MPLGCSDFDLKLFQFAIVAWSLWVCRNKMRMEGKFPKWEILLCDEDRRKLGECRDCVASWTRNFSQKRCTGADAEEIFC
ncbi:hypothetical protein PVAP13_3KG351527 [Panicum virgatum]|uniref:Uncharacterized protein n=1 Tax=Panicum virgatum TaxID=38727 RepID=A0A8T0UWF6_PANVG|nr:hypothetical protein PVAP13_3KG351527 [Panicum virgatum]